MEDGRAYGLMIALQHLLRMLERKGVISYEDTVDALDDALAQLSKELGASDASARAAKTIGVLYLPED